MKIERATVADASKISALIRQLSKPFLADSSGEGAEPFFASISEEAIRDCVSAKNFAYFIVQRQDELAGVVALLDNAHLFHLFVAKPLQAQGVGRILWQMVKLRAIELGNPGIFTINSSLNAIPVYEKFGFVASGWIVRTHGVAFQPMQLNQARNAA